MIKKFARPGPVWLLILSLIVLVWRIAWLYSSTLWFTPIGSDFTQDWVSAMALRSGNSIYGEGITRYSEAVLHIKGIENFHPPVTSLLYVPLTYFDYGVAHLILNGLSTAVFIWLIFLVAGELNVPRKWAFYLVPWILFWQPFIDVIELGQNSVLVAAMLIGGWVASRRGKPIIAGTLFGLATLIKLFPGWLAFYFILTKNWKALSAMIVTSFVGLGVSYLVVGSSDFFKYVSVVAPLDSKIWSLFPTNLSIRGAVMPFFEEGKWTCPLISGPIYGEIITALLVLLVTLVSLRAALLAIREGKDPTAFSILIIAMFLISPIAWPHYLVALILPLALTLKRAWGNYVGVLLWVISFLLVSIPNHSWNRTVKAIGGGGLISPELFLLTRGTFLGVVILWLYIVFRRPTEQ